MAEPGGAGDRESPTLHMPEWEFQRIYGRWSPLLPTQVLRLFAGVPFTWWVVGGWSLEADPRRPRRPHEDIDVAFPAHDLPAVRERLASYHLWQAGPPGLRPLLPGEDLRAECEQLWVRRDAYSPWLLDLLLTPVDGDEWVYKRDRRIRRPLRDVIRTGPDGVPYQVPEIAMLFKSRHLRDKDRQDLDVTLSRLDEPARRWLHESLALTAPAHPWLDQIVSAGTG
ncbi:MAG: nucleotidyltransferase domain-containing protein [Actinomycetes bacterium]